MVMFGEAVVTLTPGPPTRLSGPVAPLSDDTAPPENRTQLTGDVPMVVTVPDTSQAELANVVPAVINA